MKARVLLLAALSSALAGSCSDPVQSAAVVAEGKETSGIPKGPLHRAGQACVVCHQEGGPAGAHVFSLAGTVFASPTELVGVDKADVQITDSVGAKFVATTNCVGNFFVRPEQFAPRFPVLVRVAKNRTSRTMKSPIGRDPSCGSCHKVQVNADNRATSVGHIYLFGGPEPGGPSADCQVSPDLGLDPNPPADGGRP